MNEQQVKDVFEGKIGGRQYYYLLNDDHTYRPCTLSEWSEQFEKMREKKRIAYDEINDCRVSTVWLGIDHNHFGYLTEGAPLLFETMVFKGDTSNDIYMDRYSTSEQAKAGHKKALEWVLNGCQEED